MKAEAAKEEEGWDTAVTTDEATLVPPPGAAGSGPDPGFGQPADAPAASQAEGAARDIAEETDDPDETGFAEEDDLAAESALVPEEETAEPEAEETSQGSDIEVGVSGS